MMGIYADSVLSSQNDRKCRKSLGLGICGTLWSHVIICGYYDIPPKLNFVTIYTLLS